MFITFNTVNVLRYLFVFYLNNLRFFKKKLRYDFIFWCYIKQIMNVFIRAVVKIFSFGERRNFPFHSAVASWNGKFHLSPHENIFTIALINIHYLYTILYINY